MKKKMNDAWKTSGIRQEKMTDTARMQQHLVYIGSQSAQGTMFTKDQVQQDRMTHLLAMWERQPLRRNCRSGYIQKHSPEENRWRLEKQVEEMEKATIPPLMSSHYAPSVSEKHGYGSLCAMGWIGESMS
jgi:hypothetical protein